MELAGPREAGYLCGMNRIFGLVLLGAVAACGGGNGGGTTGGDGPMCVYEDAGPSARAVCPSGQAEVCGDSYWECDEIDEGWVLYGTTPLCGADGEVSCLDGEPRCMDLPRCEWQD